MIFAGNINYKPSFILQQRSDGFPKLNERTVNLTDTYTREYLDTNFVRTQSYPSTFDLDVNYTLSNDKILEIDEDENLYGSNLRTIIKATKADLSDKITVCTLNTANSVLWSLVKVNDSVFAGYVRNPITDSAEGFYLFENANTNSWTQRKTGQMLAGFADPKLQNLFRIESNGYLFACSYSSATGKNNNPPGNHVDPAPRHAYRSIDSGNSWQVVYTHPSPNNTHIHAIEFDPYRDRVWMLVGDHGNGGTPSIVYSDDYGDNWTTVGFKNGATKLLMATTIIPTRRYVLFGSDETPAAIWKWEPPNDIKNAAVYADDIDLNFYRLPIEGDLGQNFGFAKNYAADITTYPHRVVTIFSHTASYSKAAFFISPDFRNWYMMNFVNNPSNTLHPETVSGILKDGTVIGFGNNGTNDYYYTFKFPSWISN